MSSSGPSIKDVGILFKYFDTPLHHVGTFLLLSTRKLQGNFDPSPPSSLQIANLFYERPLSYWRHLTFFKFAGANMLLDYAPTNAFCKVIHTKYYEHLKKGAHQSHLGRQKNGLVYGRLARSSETEILNKIGI